MREYLMENPDCGLSALEQKVLEFKDQDVKSAEDYLALIQCLYYLFIRENVTGPSVYTLYVEEEKRPLSKEEPLKEYPVMDPLSTKNTSLQDKLLAHFERDSEQLYGKT